MVENSLDKKINGLNNLLKLKINKNQTVFN